MMALPYVSDAMAAKIRGHAGRGFATGALINRTVSLTLARWDPAQERFVARPPQDVVVEWANRAERGRGSDSASATYVDGYFKKAEPFDVEDGDAFSLGTEGNRIAGTVGTPQTPDLADIVRVPFVVRSGEV